MSFDDLLNFEISNKIQFEFHFFGWKKFCANFCGQVVFVFSLSNSPLVNTVFCVFGKLFSVTLSKCCAWTCTWTYVSSEYFFIPFFSCFDAKSKHILYKPLPVQQNVFQFSSFTARGHTQREIHEEQYNEFTLFVSIQFLTGCSRLLTLST